MKIRVPSFAKIMENNRTQMIMINTDGWVYLIKTYHEDHENLRPILR